MLRRFRWTIFFLALTVPAFADIYRYIDPNGSIHFTDTPFPGYHLQHGEDDFFGFYVLMGPFTSKKAAEGLKKKLEANGIEAFSYKQGKANFGVWFGNFQSSAEPFTIYAIMKGNGDKEAAERVKQSEIKGDYTPVCAYSYSKHFDRIDPLWPPL